MRLSSGPGSLVSPNSRVGFTVGVGGWLARWLGLLVAGSVLAAPGMAQPGTPSPGKDDFASLVKLAPFVVSGKSLEISIYARTRSDRRYGEDFSQKVAKVVYEAVTESTGKGLVIIGAKGEPHPALVFRTFLTLAKDGKLDPAIAARAPELAAMLDGWQHAVNSRKSADRKTDPDADNLNLDFEKILVALPLPLTGIGAKLYQLGWEEKFDDAKLEAKLRSLGPDDLASRDRFKSYDWVLYLSPKGAFDRVLDDIIAASLKKEKMGLFTRTAVKSVLLVMKPKIRRAIEGFRQGMMFRTLVQAQTQFTKEEISALTNAYVDVLTPFAEEGTKPPPGRDDHERAVNAVREQLRKNAENAKAATEPLTPN